MSDELREIVEAATQQAERIEEAFPEARFIFPMNLSGLATGPVESVVLPLERVSRMLDVIEAAREEWENDYAGAKVGDALAALDAESA